MEKNKRQGISVGLVSMVGIQIILSLMGVNELSTIIAVMVLITSSIVFAFCMIKDRNKNKFGAKLSIVASIIMLIPCFLTSLVLIIISCYPQLHDEHKILTNVIIFSALGSFYGLVIFSIVAWGIIKKRNNN